MIQEEMDMIEIFIEIYRFKEIDLYTWIVFGLI
jgi:hypothetical protein